MSNLPQIFDFQNTKMRVIVQGGEPWFVAKDACDILELDDVSKAVSRLDDDEKGTNSITTPGGNQEMLTVNEYGLYSLVLGSRKPEAKSFKRWITHEVIPAIRKTGSYSVQPLTPAEMFLQQAQFNVEQERKLLAIETKQVALETAQAETVQFIQNVKEAMAPIDKEWRKYINEQLVRVAQSNGNDFQRTKRDSYDLLEKRASCNLVRRVKNLKDRLSEGGATKTAIARACKLDVIEADQRLKEIYTAIVREMAIKYVA